MSCAIHAADFVRLPDGQPGARGVDLHVGHGERVALLGPNGAGKTTLMLHLNGLLHGSGRARGRGAARGSGDTLAELRARVGLVFQDPDDQLFMPTVAEDVAFGPLQPGLDDAGRAAGRRGAATRCAWSARPTARRTSCRWASGGAWRSPTVLAMRPAAARARRAVGEPRPARAARAAGGARPRWTDDAGRHARPAVRGRAVRARGDPVHAGGSSPTGRPARSWPTRSCWPDTTSSFRPASTSPACRT